MAWRAAGLSSGEMAGERNCCWAPSPIHLLMKRSHTVRDITKHGFLFNLCVSFFQMATKLLTQTVTELFGPNYRVLNEGKC